MMIKRALISALLLVAFAVVGCASNKVTAQAMSGESVSHNYQETHWSEP